METVKTDRWNYALPPCMLAYSAALHTTTGYSLAQPNLGNKLRLPME